MSCCNAAAGKQAADVASVRARLDHARAVSEARQALEASLRARLPALVQQLVGSDAQAQVPFMTLFEQELLRLRNASSLRVRGPGTDESRHHWALRGKGATQRLDGFGPACSRLVLHRAPNFLLHLGHR